MIPSGEQQTYTAEIHNVGKGRVCICVTGGPVVPHQCVEREVRAEEVKLC